ncbi:uncharacterized protein CIMG_10681 [Coccidioides immitis RS]|uniref:Uncharacterized protein n=1 Tax=Coccidioides immitis (strain RS) TaxID=246410 RepID=A0A0D8JVB6_COCIM|nr:uncharacterized protein CIMG_10681 [Coccidioides immitis RS]KJF60208.1 hypothetical protein CIMG_10681 [Coccidioides immitis RS]
MLCFPDSIRVYRHVFYHRVSKYSLLEKSTTCYPEKIYRTTPYYPTRPSYRRYTCSPSSRWSSSWRPSSRTSYCEIRPSGYEWGSNWRCGYW